MKRYLWGAIIALLPWVGCTDEIITHNLPPREAPSNSSRDTSVLSMMGWGVGLAIGIAALCSLIKSEPIVTTPNGDSS